MSERQILIVSHTARDEAVEATREAISALLAAEVTPVMSQEDREQFAPHVDLSMILELETDTNLDRIEIAIVLGGDGTILRAAELLRGSACPIVGVNLGHVGFLAEMESHDLSATIEQVLARDYTVEERVTLDVRAVFEGEIIVETWALNEASIEKLSRMLEVAVGVDGRPLTSFGCDGVVLATPTGSTAYSFSAGGPVVWPGVQAMLLVPIAAHALFNRPVVVGTDSALRVEILPESVGLGVLRCDGRRRFEVPAGTVIEARRSPLSVRLARLDPAVFTERLVRKFHLPITGWRGSAAGFNGGGRR
ncbi:NAD kinase [Leucobacter sp. GX24907]